jgi:hypothetical protein
MSGKPLGESLLNTDQHTTVRTRAGRDGAGIAEVGAEEIIK